MEFESDEVIRGNGSKYLSLITYCPKCGCYGLKRYDLTKEKVHKNETEDRYEYICDECKRGEE